MIGDYLNTMNTTFDFNFDLHPALNRMDTHKNGNKEKLSIIKASLWLLVNCTSKKLVSNKKLSGVHFISNVYFHLSLTH